MGKGRGETEIGSEREGGGGWKKGEEGGMEEEERLGTYSCN